MLFKSSRNNSYKGSIILDIKSYFNFGDSNLYLNTTNDKNILIRIVWKNLFFAFFDFVAIAHVYSKEKNLLRKSLLI